MKSFLSYLKWSLIFSIFFFVLILIDPAPFEIFGAFHFVASFSMGFIFMAVILMIDNAFKSYSDIDNDDDFKPSL